MTTDRKNFIFTVRRGIVAEIEYPGIAKLVSRLVWEVPWRYPGRGKAKRRKALRRLRLLDLPRLPKTAQKRL